MSEITLAPLPVTGRSLWQDARIRLMRNRAAVASLIVLALMTLACLIGPLLTGHPHDRVYQDYVRVPASIESYPKAEAIPAAVQRIASRVRATAGDVAISQDGVRLTLTSQRPIDQRLLVYFDRSDQFGTPKILTNEEDGRRLSLEVPIKRQRFWFGTDANGRDLLTRTLIAGRVSLAIGLLATGVALVIGVSYGATAGYLGGRIDMLMMRIVDVLYSLPFIFFVILLVVFFGRNFILMFLAVGAIEWLDMARIVRGQTLSIKRQEYVLAAEALGVTTGGILKRHVIPNTLGPVIIYVTLLVPKIILLESFLSFLGLGVQEPMTSWGVLISDGARSIQGAPWMLIFPASFLVTTLFALNFLGDGLRDALDPRDR
ncbi:ABC transporter permease subunit [Bosea sp. BIWAKO-01]|uniref:ABC transporter permease subunit n=1 Tax=Bosea sp. BIWAKO-01 TaxID=506668 RepID=UPI000852F49B|nr:ABC transporter permease subunit [Bosea sp. BIWAKO-01]GAU80773.1 oligopeptide transport system permease protein OppC [Bosea sp. BIWAKO-01]